VLHSPRSGPLPQEKENQRPSEADLGTCWICATEAGRTGHRNSRMT